MKGHASGNCRARESIPGTRRTILPYPISTCAVTGATAIYSDLRVPDVLDFLESNKRPTAQRVKLEQQ